MDKTIIFIGSYSGSGATTTLMLLKELGVPGVSTSEMVYGACSDIDSLLGSDLFGSDFSIEADREARKYIAEKVIKKRLGQDVFARAAAVQLVSMLSGSDTVAMDCFDQAEFEYTKLHLSGIDYTPFVLNIRSLIEQPDIDGQTLLDNPDAMIRNPMTEAQLRKLLFDVGPLNLVKVPSTLDKLRTLCANANLDPLKKS